eukprot:1028841-Pyramimonas_sp.AAC.1
MPPKGKSQGSENEGVQNEEPLRTALNELNKAAPAAAPSGLAVSVSGATLGDIAVPVPAASSAGAAAPAGDARPGGSAAAGSGSSARTAQSPRAPPLVPPSH